MKAVVYTSSRKELPHFIPAENLVHGTQQYSAPAAVAVQINHSSSKDAGSLEPVQLMKLIKALHSIILKAGLVKLIYLHSQIYQKG